MMDPVSLLVARYLMGEGYEAPSKEDSRYWMSVLAVLPAVVGSLYFVVPPIGGLSTFAVWGGLVVYLAGVAALVGAVFSIPSRAIRTAIILIGWGLLLSYFGRQFVLLMRY